MDILDIGCGTGLEYFLPLEPKSLSLMDGSRGMLNKAQNKMTSSSSRTKLSFKEVILPEMPYEDNSFDAGMINMVCGFKHFTNSRCVEKSLFLLLKYFYCIFPGLASFRKKS